MSCEHRYEYVGKICIKTLHLMHSTSFQIITSMQYFFHFSFFPQTYQTLFIHKRENISLCYKSQCDTIQKIREWFVFLRGALMYIHVKNMRAMNITIFWLHSKFNFDLVQHTVFFCLE